MRVGEFFEALIAYRQEKSDDRRHMGELVRGATLRLFNLQLKPADRIKDPVKFWHMPWDEVSEDGMINNEEIHRLNHLTEEEMMEEANKFMELINGKK